MESLLYPRPGLYSTLPTSLPPFHSCRGRYGLGMGLNAKDARINKTHSFLPCWNFLSSGRDRFETSVWAGHCGGAHVARAMFNLLATTLHPLQLKAEFQHVLFDPEILLLEFILIYT